MTSFISPTLYSTGNHRVCAILIILEHAYTSFSTTMPLGGDTMADNPFEIPQALRQVTEQNVKQARAAYEQLMEFMTKAMGPWLDAVPSNPMTAGLQHLQDRARQIAMENAEAAFTFGGKMSNAQTPQEILALQTQFAQDRMHAFVAQTQELCSAIAEAFQKSERGGMGISMGAMPTNLIPSNLMTGFKDVQDRAVAMAKQNAESASALVEKISKAQNVRDVFGLQSRFALEQMKAYAGQTQELHKLIGETLRKLQHG
jgi:hypothetical protein